MLDLHLDTGTHDIVFESGDVKMVTTLQELCRQQVVTAIKTFKGEWFRDINFGFPLLANDNNPVQLLGGKDQVLFDSSLRRVILNEPTVNAILSYKTSFEPVSGQLSVYIEISSDGGPIMISTTL